MDEKDRVIQILSDSLRSGIVQAATLAARVQMLEKEIEILKKGGPDANPDQS